MDLARGAAQGREKTSRTEALLEFDRTHLWHPYSSMSAPSMPRLVHAASGVRLTMEVEGQPREVIDAMSSWWCTIHGYGVKELDDAAAAQLGKMSHVMFGGLTHEPAVELAQRLVDLAPSGLDKVFLADTGSVAVEVAMKMAWQAQHRTGRTRMFTIRGGYHGDTFSPMSVCDPDGGMHAMYAGLVPEHVFAPRPPRPGEDLTHWCDVTQALFEAHAHELAAVIVEPIVQGAGSMYFYDPAALRFLTQLARAHDVLVIFDEIATGFWRTGTLWGAEHADVVPDIMCVGKALTGGYLSLAAVLTTAEVAARVDASPAGAMMHGPTFMANPLACAVAVANLDLLAAADNAARIGSLHRQLSTGLEPARDLPGVADVRVLGAIGVIELDHPVPVPAATAAALAYDVWIRPFSTLIYTMPAYISTEDEVAQICRALIAAVRAAQ